MHSSIIAPQSTNTSTAAPQQSVPGTGSDNKPSTAIGNPYALKDAFVKLDHALSELISTIGGEEGSAANEGALLQKFKAWRSELDQLRAGNGQHSDRGAGTTQEGGMFTD